MPLNSETGTLSMLSYFAQICLLTCNLHFQNLRNRKQRCLSGLLPYTLLTSFLSHVCQLSNSLLRWQLRLSIYSISEIEFSLHIFLLYIFLLYVGLLSINRDLRILKLHECWIQGEIIMELCHHIFHHHKNTSICSLENINQTKNTCLHSQKEKKMEQTASSFLDPGTYVYLCLKSSYSSRFGNPSRYILIPSKMPLQ